MFEASVKLIPDNIDQAVVRAVDVTSELPDLLNKGFR